jgi:hypothetical protein
VYFTLWASRSFTRSGSFTVVVENAFVPSTSSFSVPVTVSSPMVTSATLPSRTSDLNSLYGIVRPDGTAQ